MLFTFPSRYWFTIGRWRVFSLTRWSSRIHTRFHVSRATWEPDRRDFDSFVYRSITFFGSAFQHASTRMKLCNSSPGPYPGISGPATLCVQRVCAITHAEFRLLLVRSPLLEQSLIYFLFQRVLRCFTSPRWFLPDYEFIRRCSGITRNRLPHSEIPGSKDVCSSPGLIAAYHVLHHLPTPRHSPYALCRLIRFQIVYSELLNKQRF